MAIIEFTIHIDNPSEVVALFDRIQVWRSATQNGTYAEITANDQTAAVMDGTTSGPYTISTQTLTLILNGADPASVTFTGTDPVSLTSVIDQINAVFPGIALDSAAHQGRLRLQSTITGTQSILEPSGSALATLGLTNTHVNGKGPRLLISQNTEEYLFRDYDGQDDYWYKTRYVSTTTGAVSDFSTAFLAGNSSGLPSSTYVTGVLSLANLTGAPVVGRRIIFVPVNSQLIDDGVGNNFGVLPSVDRIEMLTDRNGQISVHLIKGQRLKVFIEGTTFNREFTVPPSDFDILQVASAEPDPFSIVETAPMPIRR